LTSTGVLGIDVHDTVGVDFESDLDLRNTSWGWWNTSEIEFTEKMVVLDKWSLTLED
jgi:hypothetical protein